MKQSVNYYLLLSTLRYSYLNHWKYHARNSEKIPPACIHPGITGKMCEEFPIKIKKKKILVKFLKKSLKDFWNESLEDSLKFLKKSIDGFLWGNIYLKKEFREEFFKEYHQKYRKESLKEFMKESLK